MKKLVFLGMVFLLLFNSVTHAVIKDTGLKIEYAKKNFTTPALIQPFIEFGSPNFEKSVFNVKAQSVCGKQAVNPASNSPPYRCRSAC